MGQLWLRDLLLQPDEGQGKLVACAVAQSSYFNLFLVLPNGN
jgi:hypothetical protein